MGEQPQEPWATPASDPADPGEEWSDADPAATDPNEPDITEPDLYEPTGLDLAHWVAGATAASTQGRPVARKRRARRAPIQPSTSGAHPDDRDPQTVGQSLDRLIGERGWSRDINVHTILGRWGVLVGPMLAQHTTPEAYTDRVITVRADSTAWATQLRHLAPRLVATLNDQLGDGTVTRISILGPDGPSWKRGRLSVRDGRGPRDTYG